MYSDHQRLELEKEFHYSRYITIRRKAELANSVGLSERQVRISQFFCFCFLSTSMRDASSEYLSLLCITNYICTGVVNNREKSANTCTKVRKTFLFNWNDRKTRMNLYLETNTTRISFFQFVQIQILIICNYFAYAYKYSYNKLLLQLCILLEHLLGICNMNEQY